MQSSGLTMLFLALFLPSLSDAQEVNRAARSPEEQRAISHISQAEYYMRKALRSLEASEKIGKAPYFNYQTAREDIEKVLAEFETYLKGDEAVDLPPAVPLIIDGRYFAESIREFLATKKPEEGEASRSIRGKSDYEQAGLSVSQTEAKGVSPEKKKKSADGEKKKLQEGPATILPPPSFAPQSGKTKRDKIEEILKKGL